MRGKTHEKHHAAHMRRARGGGVSEHENIPVVSGNPPVIREAEKHKRGGKVKKSGRARVHKGERVLTKKQDQKYRKVMRGKRSSGKR